ncbi:hypothetical protein CN244_04375 [Sinorhizobium medicae]|nr:hypothetical protein [Sinorhizobium medicae]RVQ77433.1 hypothetical protein CN244_04375 [Sinorhizobium medicae]
MLGDLRLQNHYRYGETIGRGIEQSTADLYQDRDVFLEALCAGAKRVDLAGNQVGEVSEAEAVTAFGCVPDLQRNGLRTCRSPRQSLNRCRQQF